MSDPVSFPRPRRRAGPRARVAVCAVLCLVSSGPLAAAGPAPTYVDLVNVPHQEANWDRFYGLQDHLAADFHATCAGQACDPLRRLWPLQLRCSVRAASAEVAACRWVIAGSGLRVLGSGVIEDDGRVWQCALPLGRGLAVEHFHAALQVEQPLRVRLPGADRTLLQGLHDCLAGPGDIP